MRQLGMQNITSTLTTGSMLLTPSTPTLTTPKDLGSAYFVAVDVTIVLLIAVAGLCGNAVVVVWAAYFRRLTVPVNIYVINLAVADCLFGAALPMTVPNLIAQR